MVSRLFLPIPQPGGSYDTPSEKDGGRWLSADGPYLDYISWACTHEPNLRMSDPRNRALDFHKRNTKATLLSFGSGGQPARTNFADAQELQAHFNQLNKPSKEKKTIRNVYLVEGLNAEFVAVLGKELSVDPILFVDHERTSTWWRLPYECNPAPRLPSTMESSQTFFCAYQDIRVPTPELKTYSVACAETGRDVMTTRLRGVWEQPVIVNQKCSTWIDFGDKSNWSVLILCDPPLRKVHNWYLRTPGEAWQYTVVNVSSTPSQGGYRDFIPHKPFKRTATSGPGRQSMLDSLCYYLSEPENGLTNGIQVPPDVTLFVKKIVASQYISLIEYTETLLKHVEFSFQRREDFHDVETAALEGQWSEVQLIRDRCNRYLKDITAIMVQFGIPFDAPDTSKCKSWTDIQVDFQYIYMRLNLLKEMADLHNESITGLTGIIGNARALTEARRSIREAKTVKTLTLVAMVFIPLAFTTSLFSMSDNYLPGKTRFWVFFAVSIPMVVVVFSVSLVFDFGYDSNGNWGLRTFVNALLTFSHHAMRR